MKQELNHTAAKGSPKRRGRKKWLNNEILWLNSELSFQVDRKKIVYFHDGKTSNLIPLKKGGKKIPYKVTHCDREGNVLAKVA